VSEVMVDDGGTGEVAGEEVHEEGAVMVLY